MSTYSATNSLPNAIHPSVLSDNSNERLQIKQLPECYLDTCGHMSIPDCGREVIRVVKGKRPLNVIFPRNLGGLDCAHFRDPVGSWLNLADSSDLITGISWDTDVVLALQSELNVANLQHVRAALFGVLTSRLQNLVDEGICDVED